MLPLVHPAANYADPGLSHQSSVKHAYNGPGSPPLSRAPTPLLRHITHFGSVGTLEGGDHSRSRSRVRPGRGLPDVSAERREQEETRKGVVAESLASRHEDRKETRFASPVRSYLVEKEGLINSPVNLKEDDSPYPRDERGLEMNDNARVWRIYMDEAIKADSVMTDGWNRSLDVLLVFTGLFSAVLTTFIIQSYQMLIPDPGSATNALLTQLIAMQLNVSLADVASLTGVSSGPPSPGNRQIVYVNGLWFSALSCSLSSALISMMAKQWLQAYTPNVSGSPHHRARLRQARLMQLEAWHVPAIINALPMLLHIALLLFFTGLIVLLWGTDIQVTFTTLAIVTIAYIFYSTSIWLPLLYPDCPYHHPVSAHLQKWLWRQTSMWSKATNWRARMEARVADEEQDVSPEDLEALDGVGDRILPSPPTITADDRIDAEALCWLLSSSTDRNVIAIALQAIAGLPRDFTALQILRDADALHLVEEGFQSCFHKDTTVDLQWHLSDADGAELYCKAWMRLTWGTSEQWPIDIVEPLWILQDLKSYPDAAAVASCAVALSSFDSMVSQWELLAHLARCMSGSELQLAHATQCWLLDSISECVVRWEMPKAVIENTTSRAVPILLRLLRLTHGVDTSQVKSAAALALYLFVCGPLDLQAYKSEERRRAQYCELTLQALTVIVLSPLKFGVADDSLLDLVTQELSHLASPVVAQSERFPHALKVVARSGLSKLFIDGRLGVGAVPDSTLADVLQLLFPPQEVEPSRRPAFVTELLETLETSSHPDITSWAVRLLELLLLDCPMPVSQAFADNNGINAVLRAAKAGNVDSRRLQIDSLRTLCAFINSGTKLFLQEKPADEYSQLIEHFDMIFRSDFFETLCSVVASRKWWLFEVSGHWMPALARLCYIRPRELVWPNVIRTFQSFVDRNPKEEGYEVTLKHLEDMRQAIWEYDSTDSCTLDISDQLEEH